MSAAPVFLPLLAAAAIAVATPLAATQGAAGTATAAGTAIACRLDALNEGQRERHRRLTELLERAVAGARELPAGYELALDLSRLPRDAQGEAVCVVEVAEWVDLESRCCPFLDFAIGVRGQDGKTTLALTGGPGVKAFLKTEFPLLEKNLKSRS
jgi:hypothetical protein